MRAYIQMYMCMYFLYVVTLSLTEKPPKTSCHTIHHGGGDSRSLRTVELAASIADAVEKEGCDQSRSLRRATRRSFELGR